MRNYFKVWYLIPLFGEGHVKPTTYKTKKGETKDVNKDVQASFRIMPEGGLFFFFDDADKEDTMRAWAEAKRARDEFEARKLSVEDASGKVVKMGLRVRLSVFRPPPKVGQWSDINHGAEAMYAGIGEADKEAPKSMFEQAYRKAG